MLWVVDLVVVVPCAYSIEFQVLSSVQPWIGAEEDSDTIQICLVDFQSNQLLFVARSWLVIAIIVRLADALFILAD